MKKPLVSASGFFHASSPQMAMCAWPPGFAEPWVADHGRKERSVVVDDNAWVVHVHTDSRIAAAQALQVTVVFKADQLGEEFFANAERVSSLRPVLRVRDGVRFKRQRDAKQRVRTEHGHGCRQDQPALGLGAEQDSACDEISCATL